MLLLLLGDPGAPVATGYPQQRFAQRFARAFAAAFGKGSKPWASS